MVNQVEGINIKFVADTTQLEKATKLVRSAELEIQRLAKATARGSMTGQQYDARVKQLASSLQKVTSGNIRARKSMTDYARSTYQAAEASEELVRAQNAVGRAQNRMGMATQQAGYQVGDFIVQVQSGTNAFVAFGQQATQLVGVMGMLNPKLIGIGAALGIAIPLVTAFGAAWSRSRKDLDDTSNSAEALETRIKSINAEIQEYFRNQEALSRGLTPDSLDLTKKIEEAEESLKSAQKALDAFEAGALASNLGGAGFGAAIFSGLGASGYKEALAEVEKAIERLATLQEMKRQEEAAKRADTAQQLFEARKILDEKELQERKAKGEEYYAYMLALQSAYSERILADANAMVNIIAGMGTSVSGGRGRDPRQFTNLYAYRRDLEGSGTGTRARSSSGSLKAAARETERFEKQIERTMQRVSAELRRPWEELGNTVDSSLEDAFISMVDGTKTVGEAFRTMAADIVRELYRVLVVQRMVAQFGGLVGGTSAPNSTSAGGLGGFFQSIIGNLPFLASGGTAMGGKPYIVGEQGPELFVPGSKGTVLNATQTANAMGGGETINITQVYNVNGNGDEYIMGAIKAAAPSITNDAVKAVQRERRRGGTMKQAFG